MIATWIDSDDCVPHPFLTVSLTSNVPASGNWNVGFWSVDIFVHGSTSVPHVNLYSQVHSSTAHPVETSVNATSNGAEPVAGSGKNVNAATGGTSDVVTTIKSSFVTVSLP